MKKFALLMGILLTVGCATLSGPPAPSIDGKWEGTMEMMGQSMKLGYEFKSDGNMLTGIAIGPQGEKMDITNGKINGNNISFDVEVTGQMTMTINYTGVLMEDELELTMKMDMGGGGPGGGQMPEIPPLKATRVMDAE